MDSDHSEKEPKPQLPDLIQGDAASEPDDNHYNPESQTETSTDGSSETEQIPSQTHIAHKIAGVLLLLNAVLVVAELFLFPDTGEGGGGYGGIVGSIVLGGMLVMGHPKGVLWARIGVVFGAVTFTAMYLSQGEYFSVAMQAVFSAALLLLLFGFPGKKRIIASIVMTSLVFLVSLIGIVSELMGMNLLGAAVMEGQNDLDTIPDGKLTGRMCPYAMTFPVDGNWRSMKKERLQLENPEADAWVMDAIQDAHVIVIVEEIEADVDSYVNVIMENLSLHIADKKVTKQSTQRTRGGVEGRVLELTGRVDNIELAYMYGFFSVGGRVYQIVCFTQGRNYSEFQASFSKIISSFEPAPALPQSTPPDSGTDTLSGAE